MASSEWGKVKARRRLTGAVVGAMAAGVAAGLLRRSVTRFEVVEASMSPALEPGDYLIASRLGQLKRGRVVVFAHPRRPSFALIKRVVGLEGESVEIVSGQVHIDGAILAEPWANGPTTGDGTWRLAPDQAFVLGDNRSASADDSRQIGPLTEIKWQVLFRYWPISRMGRLHDLEPMTN